MSLPTRWLVFLACAVFPVTLPAQHSTNNPPSQAELGMKKFQIASGLKTELFAAEPMLQNPVSFSIDEHGRFFVAETHRYGISILDITQNLPWLLNDLSFRKVEDRSDFLQKTFATNQSILTRDSELVRVIQDKSGTGKADSSSVFAEGFNQVPSGVAAGILARKGQVWLACIPDLWRLEAPLDSEKEQGREKLHTGFGVHIGVTGHDLHGLRLGPDGKLYMSSGDRGLVVKTKEGKLLNYPDTGTVLRCNPDGSDMEVFAIGLRNPQELAFDQYGNLFTDDNDTAGEDRSRVIHVVEGADYGWRCSYQHMSGFGPWNKEKVWMGNIDDALPWSGYVSQGPSGLAYYPGTGLPDKYKNHFLVCDFPGGVRSFAVKPRGASYETIENEKFIWNLWPTDVDFGPDSHVYISDWVEGWQMPNKGRIYRINNPAQTNNAAAEEVRTLLSQGTEKLTIKELTNLLSHADMRVRLEAQYALADKGLSASSALRDVALNKTNAQPARLHALWGIGQIVAGRLRQESHGEEFGRQLVETQLNPLLPLLGDADAEVRAQTAKQLGEFCLSGAYSGLVKLLKDASPRVQFFAANGLGKMKNKQAIGAIKDFLRRNEDHDAYLTHAGMMALLSIGDVDAILASGHDKSAAVRRVALLCMRRLENPEISMFLQDSEKRLVVEAARAINDVPINGGMPELAAILGSKHSNLWSHASIQQQYDADTKVGKSVNATSDWRHTLPSEQLLLRAINANFRLGQPEHAKILADFADRNDSPDSMRVAALEALSDWAAPQSLDRVMGLWRPLPAREKSVAQNAVRPYLFNLLQTKNEKVLVAVAHCAANLKLDEASIILSELYHKGQFSPATRIELLQALADLKDNRLDRAVASALADPNNNVRREGVKVLTKLNLPNAPELLEKLIATEKDVKLCQTAYATLAQIKGEAADNIIIHGLDELCSGKLRPELQLDLLEAAAKRSSTNVHVALTKYEESLPANDEIKGYRAVLAGGDLEEGKKIFTERAGVACMRCHAVQSKGGVVGPDLAGIGKRQTRELLLESILFPNKLIAPGFENITLLMKNGSTLAGVVKTESEKELVLNSPEDGIITVQKGEIQSRQQEVSAMPEGLNKMLSKQDLRNLVEYLANLK
ncbi:PVC-type heme-binding CxxCH protein [Pedosphaera parvula]|uniref:PVC-type heme-binding CxxCH protein n=1 Tax=Pedosphaera parvula TaxID=1032527 RepID=UPI00135F169F|nr:PVC-type heme-binding CxxCH protein [Pedosphaera parvula]